MLSRGEESCGEVGLNSGFSGFFMVGDDMSAQRGGQHIQNTGAEDTEIKKSAGTDFGKERYPGAVDVSKKSLALLS